MQFMPRPVGNAKVQKIKHFPLYEYKRIFDRSITYSWCVRACVRKLKETRPQGSPYLCMESVVAAFCNIQLAANPELRMLICTFTEI
jgi:hypothetical protein